jgi:hypothetical protein
MFDFATVWLIQNKILLPGVSTPDSPTKVVKEWKIGVIFAHDSLSRTL